MRRARDLIGLPVIDVSTGKQLGTVKDIGFDSDWLAAGLVLETKNWFLGPGFLDWDDALAIGEDAVTVDSESRIGELPDNRELARLLGGRRLVVGIPILTANGQQLGIVADVYFSAEMDKRIIGYELSDGFLSDVTDGRRWLPAPDRITMGEDVIVVPVQCLQEVEELPYEE